MKQAAKILIIIAGLCLLINFSLTTYLKAGGIGELRKDIESEVKKADNEDVFYERLRDAASKNSEAAIAKLLAFSKEYPDSRFGEDARFVANFMLFRNDLAKEIKLTSMGDERERLLGYIKAVVNIITQYPDGQLRVSTYRKIAEVVGGEQAAKKYNAMRIPYRYFIYYMNGMAAAKFNDWQTGVDNLSVLKNTLSYSKDCRGAFEFDIYPGLANANMKLGRFQEAYDVAKEGLDRFPDNEWFGKFIDEVKPKVKQ